MQAYYWQPSPWLRWFFLFLTVLAIFAVLSSRLPQPYQHGLLFIYFCYGLYNGGFLLSGRALQLQGLRYQAQRWQLWSARDDWQDIRPQAHSLVLPWLIILYYRKNGQLVSRALVIFRWAGDLQGHRRLRLWLRLMALQDKT